VGLGVHRDGWIGHASFLDGPDEITAQGASVKLNDIRVVDSVGPTGPATNDGVRKIKVSVIKPETLGGRPTSSEVEPEAPDFMSAYTDGEIVSGAYGELDDQNFVLMSAVTSAHLLYPDSQLGTLLDQLQADDPNLTDPQPVPAGILSGIARCGESKFGDKPRSCASGGRTVHGRDHLVRSAARQGCWRSFSRFASRSSTNSRSVCTRSMSAVEKPARS
jgi:hypothetical protein